ncbi:unnamed protein product [Polarella glacialis]|uniref:Fibronectin type-III domain-containing protein n=1 Tax=Polarella glacialis TaxID=89957 RepID=A0A813DPK2_POLGL|nr:unnamed protein product [Polarella glacialis]CAE8680000.1 unnamed protein product [Polarella glacialis]
MAGLDASSTKCSWARISEHPGLIHTILHCSELADIVHAQMLDRTLHAIVISPGFASTVWQREFPRAIVRGGDPWSQILVTKLTALLPMPGNLQCFSYKARSHNSLKLVFSAPNSDVRPATTGCRLEIMLDGQWVKPKTCRTMKTEDNGQVYFNTEVTSLIGNTTYQFRAQSFSSIGSSTFSYVWVTLGTSGRAW